MNQPFRYLATCSETPNNALLKKIERLRGA